MKIALSIFMLIGSLYFIYSGIKLKKDKMLGLPFREIVVGIALLIGGLFVLFDKWE